MSVWVKIQYLIITDLTGMNTLSVSREKSVTTFYKILRKFS